jgi:hypothetical protein
MGRIPFSSGGNDTTECLFALAFPAAAFEGKVQTVGVTVVLTLSPKELACNRLKRADSAMLEYWIMTRPSRQEGTVIRRADSASVR